MQYIALLRGINVGENNKVAMSDLKACFVNAGFQKVSTYINSGNVIFSSDEHDTVKLIGTCEEILLQQFEFPISLAIIAAEDLKDALEHAPAWWGDDPDSKHNAIFVIAPATAAEIMVEAGKIKPEYEQIHVYQEVIFWSAPLKTFSRTRFSKIVGTKAYQYITIRNANTAKKLLQLALTSL